MFNKILRASLITLVFLFPVFWLPFSFEWIEFNKLYLMFFLGAAGILAWILKMIFQDREIKIRFSAVDLFVLIFLFLGFISAIFSIDRISSIFGTYGRFNNGFLALFSFVCFYFLARNNFEPSVEKSADLKEKETEQFFGDSDKTEELKIGRGIKITIKDKLKSDNSKRSDFWNAGLNSENIFAFLFWGAFFATIWTALWIFGLGRGKALFSFVSGSANGFSIYLSLMIVLVLSKMVLHPEEAEKGKEAINKKIERIKKGAEAAFIVLAFFLLLVFDYSAAWIVLGSSLIFFIIFAINKGLIKENIHRLIIPIFFVVLCGVFLITNTFWIFFGLNNNFLRFPVEPVLGQGESLRIGILSAKENIKNFFVGSGIGTFLSDYAMFKSDKMNDGLLWQIRFDRAGNNFAEVLATTGFLGLGLFLAIIFLAIKKFSLQKERATENQIIWQSVFVGAILSQIFFYQNMVLGGIFWLALGISANFSDFQEKKFSIKDRPLISICFETFAIIFLIILSMGAFFGIKFYKADLKYARGINASEIDKKISFFGEAIKSNRYQSQYQIAMSQALIIKLGQEIARTDISSEEKQKILAAYLDILNQYAKNAVSVSPNQIMTRQNLANIYRDFIGIAGGAEEWAITSYNKAIELEPKNPVLYVERGKVYEASNKKDEARSDFEKAKEIAPSYPAATLALALLEEKEGKNEKAISLLEDFLNKFLNRYGFSVSADIVFNLGRIYYNNDQIDQAIDILEVARLAMPQNSNILYMLGLAYQKKGNINEAKNLIEKVLELNPGNEEVKKKLEELESR